jgi:hypothetical protein
MSLSPSDLPAPTGGDFILYTAPDGAVMAELFQRDKSVISRHINNVFDEGELVRKRVVANYATTAADSENYQTRYYNLDAIIFSANKLVSRKMNLADDNSPPSD